MRAYVPPADDEEARHLVRRTFDHQPDAGFTADLLATSLALPVATVQRVLGELVRAGLVVELDDEYVSALQLD